MYHLCIRLQINMSVYLSVCQIPVGCPTLPPPACSGLTLPRTLFGPGIKVSGSLQIPQQNLTVSHQFNICHKLTRKYYKNLTPPGSQHITWRFFKRFQACCYIRILSIPGMCPVFDALPPCISNRDICC